MDVMDSCRNKERKNLDVTWPTFEQTSKPEVNFHEIRRQIAESSIKRLYALSLAARFRVKSHVLNWTPACINKFFSEVNW